MTLYEIFKIINNVAVSQPNINTVVNTGNVYDLNTENYQIKYSAFCVQQGEHTQNGDFMTYNFNLFYVDRLTDEKRNKLEVQSNAITTLNNIINGLIQIELIDVNTEITYQVFTERFAAECAGAYCTLRVTTDTPYCYDEFINRVGLVIGDFNYDFNSDFFIKKFKGGEFNKESYDSDYNKDYTPEKVGEFSNAFTINGEAPYDSYNVEFNNSMQNDTFNKDDDFNL